MVVCAYVPVERVYHYYDWLVTHNEYNRPKNVTKQIKILKTHWLYVGFVRNESLLLYLIPLSMHTSLLLYYSGVWNVPFLTGVYMIQGHVLPSMRSGYTDNRLDSDMALCHNLRNKVNKHLTFRQKTFFIGTLTRHLPIH